MPAPGVRSASTKRPVRAPCDEPGARDHEDADPKHAVRDGPAVVVSSGVVIGIDRGGCDAVETVHQEHANDGERDQSGHP